MIGYFFISLSLPFLFASLSYYFKESFTKQFIEKYIHAHKHMYSDGN